MNLGKCDAKLLFPGLSVRRSSWDEFRKAIKALDPKAKAKIEAKAVAVFAAAGRTK